MSDGAAVELEVIATEEQLPAVLMFVRSHCLTPGEDTNRTDLIVEELFLNIARHACPGQLIRILCRPAPATLEFHYRGPAFDPVTDAPAPDLNTPLAQRRPGGLGIFLARSLADSVTYRRENDVNRLTIGIDGAPR